jgi:hypothetical protein
MLIGFINQRSHHWGAHNPVVDWLLQEIILQYLVGDSDNPFFRNINHQVFS